MSRVRALAAIVAMTAAIGVSGGGIVAESPEGRSGTQPHGHRSSRGSTSNLLTKAEKKRRNKLARKSRKNGRR